MNSPVHQRMMHPIQAQDLEVRATTAKNLRVVISKIHYTLLY